MLIVVAGLSFTSCKKAGIDPVLSCNKAAEEFSSKLIAFAFAPTKASCETYVDAAKQYLKSCTALTATERREAEKDLNDTNCNDF